MKKAIVLLSGGLDSATTLYIAKKQGYECLCLIFDYGQRHKREIECARRIAKAAKCKYQVLKIALPWKGSALLDRKLPIPKKTSRRRIPSTYVPARNLIFLSFALSFAEARAARAVFIGANVLDYSGYPDCRPEFYAALKKVIRIGLKRRSIDIKTPLIKKSKAEIIKLGMRLGVPYKYTNSCYSGKAIPCGRCDSCRFRAKGFKEAGIKDPLCR